MSAESYITLCEITGYAFDPEYLKVLEGESVVLPQPAVQEWVVDWVRSTLGPVDDEPYRRASRARSTSGTSTPSASLAGDSSSEFSCRTPGGGGDDEDLEVQSCSEDDDAYFAHFENDPITFGAVPIQFEDLDFGILGGF